MFNFSLNKMVAMDMLPLLLLLEVFLMLHPMHMLLILMKLTMHIPLLILDQANAQI